jgi:hypothetical protein
MKVLVVRQVRAMIFYKKTPTENDKKMSQRHRQRKRKATPLAKKLDRDQ